MNVVTSRNFANLLITMTVYNKLLTAAWSHNRAKEAAVIHVCGQFYCFYVRSFENNRCFIYLIKIILSKSNV